MRLKQVSGTASASQSECVRDGPGVAGADVGEVDTVLQRQGSRAVRGGQGRRVRSAAQSRDPLVCARAYPEGVAALYKSCVSTRVHKGAQEGRETHDETTADADAEVGEELSRGHGAGIAEFGRGAIARSAWSRAASGAERAGRSGSRRGASRGRQCRFSRASGRARKTERDSRACGASPRSEQWPWLRVGRGREEPGSFAREPPRIGCAPSTGLRRAFLAAETGRASSWVLSESLEAPVQLPQQTRYCRLFVLSTSACTRLSTLVRALTSLSASRTE